MTRRTGWIVAAIVAAHAGLLLWAAARNSVTLDECTHLPAGLAYWRFGALFIGNVSPPLLRLWAALPLALSGVAAPAVEVLSSVPVIPIGARHIVYAEAFARLHGDAYHALFLMGRAALIPLSCFGAWVVFRWARDLYGDRAGVAACALFAVCPNILAHGSLVGTDAGTMVFMVASVWLWDRYRRRPGASRWALAALAVGLAHLCKYAALLLWPVLLVMALVQPQRWRLVRGWVWAALAALVLFNAGYAFQGSGAPLREYPHLQTLPIVRHLPGGVPVPLPREFLEGARIQAADAWSRRTSAFLLDRYYRGTHWAYYPVTLLCKLPVGTLLLLVLALRSLWAGWGSRLRREEWPVLAAAAAILIGVVGGVRLNVGIRYLLPVLPFLFIFAGRLWTTGSRERWVCTALLLFAAVESAVAAPRYLSFMNLPFRDPAVGYRVVNFSSFDWGQSLLDLKDWMARNRVDQIELVYLGPEPRLYGISAVAPAPLGQPAHAPYVAVSAYYLAGVPVHIPQLVERNGLVQISFYRALQRRRPAALLGSLYVFRRADWEAAAREP